MKSITDKHCFTWQHLAKRNAEEAYRYSVMKMSNRGELMAIFEIENENHQSVSIGGGGAVRKQQRNK